MQKEGTLVGQVGHEGVQRTNCQFGPSALCIFHQLLELDLGLYPGFLLY